MFLSLRSYLRFSRPSATGIAWSSRKASPYFCILSYPSLHNQGRASESKMPLKRKRSSVAKIASAVNIPTISHETPILSPRPAVNRAPPKQQAYRRGKIDTNPDHNADIVDGKTALRASPDADEKGESLDVKKVAQEPRRTSAKTNGIKEEDGDSPLSDLETPAPPSVQKQKKSPTKSSVAAKKGSDEIKAFKAEQAAKKAAATKVKKEDDEDEWEKRVDPDGDEDGPTDDIDTIKNEAARPPPVNSDYLPLPWKGRLGYVRCINFEFWVLLTGSF